MSDLIGGLLFIILSLICFLIIVNKRRHIKNCTVPIQGKYIGAYGNVNDKGHLCATVTPYFHYGYNGRKFNSPTVNNKFCWFIAQGEAAKRLGMTPEKWYRIYVDPKKPRRCRTEKTELGDTIVFGVLGIIMLVLGVIIIIASL